MGMKLSTADSFKQINRLPKGCLQLSDEQVKAYQQVLLTMLEDIAGVCERNHIGFFLSGGTALGAKRHKGFIPWDDDIDLNMTRREYERFIAAFKEAFSRKYWIHTPEQTHNYALLFGRIRLKNTVVRTRDDFATEECGAFVDIFIVENTYDARLPRALHGFLCTASGLLLSCRKFYWQRRALLAFAKEAGIGRKAFLLKVCLGFCLSWLSVDCWTHLANACSKMCKNDESEWVTIPAGKKRFFGELYPRHPFVDTSPTAFEGRQYPQTCWEDGYLRALYGDYETPPPPQAREKHILWEFSL